MKREQYKPQERCPHCGGLHFGQRYDNCTYVNILNDPCASGEAKANAKSILDAHKSTRKSGGATQ